MDGVEKRGSDRFEERLNRSRRAADLPPTPRHGGRIVPGNVPLARDGNGGIPPEDRGMSDLAWSMFSKIVAGLLIYGGAGWALDRWLGFDAVFLPMGVLLGAGIAIYLVFVRLDRDSPPEERDR